TLSPQVSDNGTSKAHCPTAVLVCKKHSFERMLRAASFRGPMLAAVSRVNDRSFCAHGPAFICIDKLHIKQIDGNGRFLSLPRPAAIHCAVNTACASDGPSIAIVDERRGCETN